MLIASRPMYLSQKVGWLSELAAYFRYGRVIKYYIPWLDGPRDICESNFVLENDDNFILENDDQFEVSHPCT